MALDTIPKQEGGKLKAVASGTLPSGQPVVVNADGTVSIVEETTFSEAVGTPVVVKAGSTYGTRAIYDSANQKVIISYSEDSGGKFPSYVVVGTISDTSISFGSPTQANVSALPQDIAYDAGSGKVVIAYAARDASDYGFCRVGTVSGTSISLGTAVAFHSSSTSQVRAVYDSASEKTVILYKDGNNVDGEAIVGTVSGTSISFGSPTVFEGDSVLDVDAVYDSTNQKIVVAYRNGTDSNNSTAIVGTVSGTSISFGTRNVYRTGEASPISLAFDSTAGKVIAAYKRGSAGEVVVLTVSGTSISGGTQVEFASNVASGAVGVTYDPLADKVVVCYGDAASSNQGTYKLGTVSGTSISFGSSTVFETGSTSEIGPSYCTGDARVVIAYRDSSNSGYATATILRNAYTSTNLTSENYIGISTGGAVADGGNANVGIVGSVSDEQSGLTSGQQYYVQTDGALSETPADPSVLAGTAISATKMLVKT